MYASAGFEVTDSFTFDPERAAPTWDYERFDQPNDYLMKWKGAPVDAKAERTPLRRLSAEELERIWDEAVAHADLTLTDEQRKVRAYLLGQARTQW